MFWQIVKTYSMLESFFIYGKLPDNIETGIYLLPLVALSYLVAFFASYTALSLGQQLVGARNVVEKYLLRFGGAFAMGAGIWSMHFIGMLSYKMRMKVEYDPLLTILSMLIAIAFSYGMLITIAKKHLYERHLALGAVLLGLGICSMHYTGMAAMKMDADLGYIPSFFFLSVLIAIVASGAALLLAFKLVRYDSKHRYIFQLGAAAVMGAAICGMHYTGMAASVFIPYATCRYDPEQDFITLALSIAVISATILWVALAIGGYRKTQTEFLLQNSENKLRTIIDNALDSVVSMDSKGMITEWNRQAEVLFGYLYDEAIGRQLGDLIIPHQYREAHKKGLEKFFISGEGPILNKRIEIEALNRDGGVFPVELSISVQKLKDTYNFTAFIRDITKRKQNEEKIIQYTKDLERSNQELEDFAHIVSHDLKEPIRGLSNYAMFLLEDYQDRLDADGIKKLERIKYLSKRMEQLINDLLYFSQLGRVELAVQEMDMNVTIHEIEQLMEGFIKENNACIIIPKPLPVIICDKPRVTELLRNLITNAIKYNDKQERIVEIGFLENVKHKDKVHKDVFYVKDNGIGMEEKFHDQIFRIFKRLQVDPKKEEGSGVGLSFVKKIIDRYKGDIWIESELGKGSTFYFTLECKRKKCK